MGILIESLSRTARQLRSRGGWYWARVVVVSCVGLLLSRWLGDNSPRWAQGMQLPVYQFLSTAGPRQAEFQHVAIVEITDEEFWKGELAGRRPVKRAYIADLVAHLCNQGAHVVALDFDLRSPLPDGSLLNHADYKEETDALARAIQGSPATCRIVLARTLYCPNPPAGECTSEPSVLDSYAFDANRISWGYINLPSDARQIPLRRANIAHGMLDSFAQAIAIADSPELTGKLRSPRDFRFGSFISVQAFEDAHLVFRAQDVLHDTSAGSSALSHKTLVVGGAWHANEYGRGPLIDSHIAPVGAVPGVFLHANYAAALLDGRAYPQASKVVRVAVDVLALGLVAAIFALPTTWGRRWTRIGVFAVILAVVSYLFWLNLGVFLEITVPVVLLLSHALVDEYLEMREELMALRQKVAGIRTHRNSHSVNGGVVLGKVIKLVVVVALLMHGRAAMAQTNDTGGVPATYRGMNETSASAAQPDTAAHTEGRPHTRKHTASCKQLGSIKGLKGSHLKAFLKACEAKRLAE